MSRGRPLRAVVTAGGTEEAVDAVRTLSNVSSGRFGSAIARALDRRGIETTVLASRALAARGAEELRGGVRTIPYRSFADLDRALAALESDPPDLLFMAAAVSDFGPAPAAGKLSSDAPFLDLHLVRNPKLLARLRAALGDRVVLVGFKLLTGAGAAELERIARAQARSARLDLTVANDLVELTGDRHPVLLVPPDGQARRIEGHREDVASHIVDAALALVDARDGATTTRPELALAVSRAADRLGWDAGSRAVRIRGGEPSLLLDGIEGIDALLAVEDALGRFDADLDEGEGPSDEAACAALAEAARAGRWNGGPFALGMEAGGALIGLDARAAAALGGGLDQALAAFDAACPGAIVVRERARAVLDGARVVGAVLPTPTGALVPFLVPHCRGRGLGGVLARALAARGARIAVRESDADFFTERGFLRAAGAAPAAPSAASAASGWVELAPPDPTRVIAAASAALVDPLRQRVLLGRRRVAPYQGFWALPGGKCAAGEDARAAAVRELAEETGVTLAPGLAPRAVVRVLAGDGARVFSIESFVFLVLRADLPTSSAELDASWVSLTAARALRPMTAGTRLVLERIEALLAGAR